MRQNSLYAVLRIRVANPASRALNLTKTFIQTALMWSVALWIVPLWIVRIERQHLYIPTFPPLVAAGWILFAVAGSIGLWSGWTMAWYGDGTPLPLDTARNFVVRGPYCWIRNPMACAGLAQGIAVSLMLGSYLVLLYSLLGIAAWQWLARPIEEADLQRRFGSDYLRYQAEVPCWRPRTRGGPYVIKG